jgi:hypothetical protein
MLHVPSDIIVDVWESSLPQSRSQLTQRRSFSNAAWYASRDVLQVLPRSSVWTSRARGLIFRIAAMASTTARHWVSNAWAKLSSSRACGYHWPYRPEKRAVVSGSLTGVYSSTQG